MPREPDFIIIGAMKCATTTLHEQLAAQPGFFMSRPKEPNYFSDDEVAARGPDWYRGLFAGARDEDLCGESSTHYTKLPTHPRTIDRMQAALPRVKLLYVMRAPVDRLISHYLHNLVRGQINLGIDEAIKAYPELIDYSRYQMQIAPYLAAFGAEDVLPVFFERLVKFPEAELERIGQFLGAPRPLRWDRDMKPQNVTSEQLCRSALRDALVYDPILTTFRRRLIPKAWSERLKALWRMREERPSLRCESRDWLHEIFDEDLARLSPWLGREFNSRDFREIALAPPGEPIVATQEDRAIRD